MSPQDIRAAAIAARRDELLTVQEFADMTRVHPLSIYRRIRFGRQPGVCRIGRDIRIDVTIALKPAAEDEATKPNDTVDGGAAGV